MKNKREWAALLLVAVSCFTALAVSIHKMFLAGSNGERLRMAETKELLAEITILFAIFCLNFGITKCRKLRAGLLIAAAAGFSWIHQVFLPMALSGLYLAVIIRVGSGIRKILDKNNCLKEYELSTLLADFVLGAVTMTLLFCLMSLVGIGAIEYTRIAAVLLAAATFLPQFPGRKERKRYRPQIKAYWNEKERIALPVGILCSLIMTMLLLQVGRMNICADYDSLHYGLRSEYILNNGGGIYENLGNINVVYTYSKGLEILLFPISGLPSYSFFLSFQMWMTAGILLAAGIITNMFVCRKSSILCMTFLACIPGITNMGITAKTDSMTALIQLIMIYFLLQFVQKKCAGYLALAGNAFLLTMVLKPTSLVFSTVIAGTAFFYLIAAKKLRFQWKDRFFLSWIAAIAMWLLVWLRTLLHTGLPVTSVFTSIWTMLGFSVKYPFRFDELPASGGDLGIKGALKYFLKRLYGVLLAPVTPDMDHVWIAWGTCLLFVFCFLFLVPFFAPMQKPKDEEKSPLFCLVGMFVMDGMVSLLALYLLWQVDGNYFILLYCLFGILAAVVIGKLKDIRLSYGISAVLVPVLLFNVAVTAVSNWNGTLGLSPVTLVHQGYYDHWQEEKEKMILKGNEKIWNILAEDPKTRVIVYGNQPEMLMFPCNTQSYLDIEGSGGNYEVSSSMEKLTEFFKYAKIDYVYLGSGYLKPGTQKWNFVIEMLENGYLTDLIYENGNVLAQFTEDPVVPAEPEIMLHEFAQCYWAGEQQ